MAKNRMTYKDFETGKIHYTRGRFIGWTNPTGLLNVPYAIFARGSDNLLVPEYLLTQDCRRAISGIVDEITT